MQLMRTSMGRSQRVSGLRLSLLASLGLLPVACGGSSVTSQPDARAQGGAAGSRPEEPSVGGGGAAGARPQEPNVGGGGVAGARPQEPNVGGGGVAGSRPQEPNVGGGGVAGGQVTDGGSPPVSVGLTNSGDGIPTCESPQLNERTQLVVCANGYSHRPNAVVCAVPPDAQGGAGGAGGGGGIRSACTSDADCAGVPHGFCRSVPPFKECASACATDNDCQNGGVCFCDGSNPYGTCVAATCRTDADCGAGRCAEYFSAPCSDPAFACQKAEDHCGADICATCASGFKAKACGNCGRPFLVNDQARTAPVEANRHWLARELDLPVLSGLNPTTRAALAAHWSRLGQMEHASIAAFARFNLQLLSLGAPAELIESCTQALADETSHTKLCFGLATHYAGLALGPSRLDVSQSLNETSLLEIMSLVLKEGCIGETCAALEAAESAELALDPALKHAYARIAQDEQRHADLAFRFLRWALAQATLDEQQQFASEAGRLERELSGHEPASGTSSVVQRELVSHGVLDSSTLGALRRSAARDVTWPLLEALLAVNHAAERPGERRAGIFSGPAAG